MIAGIWTLGCLCSLSFGPMNGFRIFGNSLFEFYDRISSNFLMAIGAMLFSLFIGWKMKKSDVYFFVRYIAPLVIGIIFISGLLL